MIKTVTFLLKSVGRNKQESSKANIGFYIADQFKTIRNLNFLTILVETDLYSVNLKERNLFLRNTWCFFYSNIANGDNVNKSELDAKNYSIF